MGIYIIFVYPLRNRTYDGVGFYKGKRKMMTSEDDGTGPITQMADICEDLVLSSVLPAVVCADSGNTGWEITGAAASGNPGQNT